MNQDVYYLAISGCQKAVRRGMAEVAVKLGHVAWSMNKGRFYNRLHVILFEEGGRDRDIIRKLYTNPPSSKWETQAEFIRMVAKSKAKSNETVALMFFLTKKTVIPPTIRDELVKRFDRRATWFLEILDGWDNETKFYTYDELSFPPELEWVLTVCERCGKMEQLSYGVPYFMIDYEHFKIQSDCEPGELWEGIIPYAAMDCHTRIGRMSNGILRKKHEALQVMNKIGEWVFRNEGRLIVDRMTYPIPFRQLLEVLLGGAVNHLCFNEYQDELNNIRKWAMENPYVEAAMELKHRVKELI